MAFPMGVDASVRTRFASGCSSGIIRGSTGSSAAYIVDRLSRGGESGDSSSLKHRWLLTGSIGSSSAIGDMGELSKHAETSGEAGGSGDAGVLVGAGEAGLGRSPTSMLRGLLNSSQLEVDGFGGSVRGTEIISTLNSVEAKLSPKFCVSQSSKKS